MEKKTLIQSRENLLRSANRAMREITILGWAITDGRATREDAMEIASTLADAIDANSRDTLDDMTSKGKH